LLEKISSFTLKLNKSIRENINLFDKNVSEQPYFYNRFLKFKSDSQAAKEQFENTISRLGYNVTFAKV